MTKTYRCEICDYCSNYSQNVTRHCKTIHLGTAHCKIDWNPKTVIEDPKTVIDIIDASENTNNDVLLTICNTKCLKCEYIFSSIKKLKIHIPKCKGIINPLQCPICCKVYNNTGNKSRHYKICKEKNLIAIANSNITSSESVTINNNSNNNNNNNSIIGNNNNIQNNVIINFNDDKLKFNLSDITDELLLKILQFNNFDIPELNHLNILNNFSRFLLEKPENKCVKKTNLRSSVSAVHVGDNKWEYRQDADVYPKLNKNISENFYDILCNSNEKIKMKKGLLNHTKLYKEFKRNLNDLTIFSEFIQCYNGNTQLFDDETNKYYIKSVFNLKTTVYDLTKQQLTSIK